MKTPSDLITHLNGFLTGQDRSVEWAKRAEALLDDLEPEDEVLEEFHHDLAFYRPGGGDHLLDEQEMEARCRNLLERLERGRG